MILWELIRKDLLILSRKRAPIILPVIFSFISAVILSFFLQNGSYELMWIVFLFSSIFPQIEIMKHEFEDKIVDTLKIYPLRSEIFFLSKFFVGLIFLLFVGFCTTAFFVFFTNLGVSFDFFVSFCLAVFGINSVSTLFSFYAVSDELSLPAYYIIVSPFYVPVIVASVKFAEGDSFSLNIILSFDVINFLTAFSFFDIKR